MSNRRKIILAILLVFTVALGALSIYITTQQQAPGDTGAASNGGDNNTGTIALTGNQRCIVVYRCKDALGQLKPCSTADGDYDGYSEIKGRNNADGTAATDIISAQNEANAFCKRVQIDLVPQDANGNCVLDHQGFSGAIGTPDPAACPSLAVCPANIENLAPVVRVRARTGSGNNEEDVYYNRNDLDLTNGAEIPYDSIAGQMNAYVCRNCTAAELLNPPAAKLWTGRFRVVVLNAAGTVVKSDIYTDITAPIKFNKSLAGVGGRVRVQILKDFGTAVCKATNVKLTQSVGEISCDGTSTCFRTDPNVAQGNCSSGFTCSTTTSKCELNACAANPALCGENKCELITTDLTCGSECSSSSQCTNGHSCNAGKCELDACIANPGSCNANKCEVLTTNLTCGSTCSSTSQCSAGHQCENNKCVRDICANGDPSNVCRPNNCELITNILCGSTCLNDGVTNQCRTGQICDAAVGAIGSCKLITCATNPAACSDTIGCNLQPLPSCGDASCNANELCERTSVNGTTYRACGAGDTGSAPTGELVESCTFTGANACQQVPPEPEIPVCGETCGTDGLCPNNHTCNSSNICVLNTCLTPGACSDNTCTPTTSTTPICGGACANNTQCPTNHSCNNGKCVLNGCTASTCTNGCTVIPATGILDDARFLLVGMSLVTLGYLTYKYRIGRSLSLGLIDSEALFVEKLERSVEKKMRRRNK